MSKLTLLLFWQQVAFTQLEFSVVGQGISQQSLALTLRHVEIPSDPEQLLYGSISTNSGWIVVECIPS